MLAGTDEHALRSVDEVSAVERKCMGSGVLNAVTRQIDVRCSSVQDFDPFTGRPRFIVLTGPRIGHHFGHDNVTRNEVARNRRRVDLTRCWVVGLNPVCGGAVRVLLVTLARHDAPPGGLVEVVVVVVHQGQGHPGVGHVEAGDSVSGDDDVLPCADGPG